MSERVSERERKIKILLECSLWHAFQLWYPRHEEQTDRQENITHLPISVEEREIESKRERERERVRE